jgi:DNA-binding NarL/FixJ family response regulator
MSQPSVSDTNTGLSPGVLRTLELLAHGLETDDVAERLCTDPSTIRHYVAEAKATLGARSKMEAIVMSLRAGLIDLHAAECSGCQGGSGR